MELLAGKPMPRLELEAAEGGSIQRVWANSMPVVSPEYSFPNLHQFEKKFADAAEEYEPKDKILVFQFSQAVHDKYNISFDDIKICPFYSRLLINGLEIHVFQCTGRVKVGDAVIYDKKLYTDNFEKLCLEKVA